MDQRALAVFAYAVSTFEGGPGSRNFRNNNPGNLKFANQRNTTGMDRDGFAIFRNMEDGFLALEDQILLDARRNPDWTITDFVNSYAPPSDHNENNARYAKWIAAMFTLEPTDTMQRALDLI